MRWILVWWLLQPNSMYRGEGEGQFRPGKERKSLASRVSLPDAYGLFPQLRLDLFIVGLIVSVVGMADNFVSLEFQDGNEWYHYQNLFLSAFSEPGQG